MTQFEFMYVAQYMDRFEMESTHGYSVSISIDNMYHTAVNTWAFTVDCCISFFLMYGFIQPILCRNGEAFAVLLAKAAWWSMCDSSTFFQLLTVNTWT